MWSEREGEDLKGWIAHEDVPKGRNYDAVSFFKKDWSIKIC